MPANTTISAPAPPEHFFKMSQLSSIEAQTGEINIAAGSITTGVGPGGDPDPQDEVPSAPRPAKMVVDVDVAADTLAVADEDFVWLKVLYTNSNYGVISPTSGASVLVMIGADEYWFHGRFDVVHWYPSAGDGYLAQASRPAGTPTGATPFGYVPIGKINIGTNGVMTIHQYQMAAVSCPVWTLPYDFVIQGEIIE